MHIPVLLKEVIEILNPQPGEFFIDGTVGSGGHALAILEKIGPKGKLLGVDWDEEAVARCKSQIANRKNVILVQGNYADLPEILEKKKLGRADGLLLDLGMSSEQLEKSGRGFAFQKDEPLDMRYNTATLGINQRNQHKSAAQIVNTFSEKELADIFWRYGEERYSRRIARKIIEQRKIKPIETTFDLVNIILSCQKSKVKGQRSKSRIHPATRVFQALRIYINNELENLEKLLKNLAKILAPGGRAAIISYHSLEDRLVKNAFKELKNEKKAQILTNPEGKPSVSCGAGKPIRPTREEIINNPRSRSAKLRAIKLRFNSELRMQD